MELYAIETGTVKFDGGSMFGIIPRAIWQGLYPMDKRGYGHWAMRCLLVVDGNRKILIDTGIGTKQSKGFLKYYTEKTEYTLENSLNSFGFKLTDITDIVLTHLHFDHCGGCIQYNDNEGFTLTFPNAIIHTSKQQWQWAQNPNEREEPSFLKENIDPIKESGKLRLFDKEHELFPNFYVKLFNGHTDGQVIPHIKINGKTLVFCADLFPSTAHLPLPYIMAYDTRPLISIEDKKRFFKEAIKNDYVLFFEHDLYTECCTLTETDKGAWAKDKFSLAEFLKS
ncbi:MAG: MBL fold metallo-hydrolase [Bacteroidetes bacterium 4572_117]|nr:MAG: MBL fold metallo-hydrolase [Bacteroidetes bacterium 4572_117]